MFADVEETPSHDVLFTALARAADLHLTSGAGCRVPVHNTNLYLWFDTPAPYDRFQEAPDPDDDLFLRLERIDGREIAQLNWPKDQTAEDFLVALAEAVIRAGEYPGDNSFEAGRLFADLSEVLELAHKSATSGSANALTGVVQYCPPQWVITETALISVGKPAGYTIPISRIREPHWPSHLAGKPWLDRDSFDDAFEAGSQLYEARRLTTKPPSTDDEPPF